MHTILVSACLLGESVRYDGKSKQYNIDLLIDRGIKLISCCPEVDGGLSIPRPPSEIQKNGSVLNCDGEDVTIAFEKGAFTALNLVNKHAIKIAIMKSKSPSCSNKMIYDGSFSRNPIKGQGMTVRLLVEHGVKVFDETEIQEAVAYLESL